MSKAVSKFALAASLSLAMAFMASCVGDGSSAFVGKWVTEDGSPAPSGLPDNLELFKDGTGVMEGKSISWKVENKRFVISSSLKGFASAFDYEISGRMLTLTDDNGKREIYLRPQEEKIEGKALIDNRDGKKYKTVIIGTQTWMAENLNYETKSSVCYDNKPENCGKYGRLYNWATAKDVCPDAWHLPSKKEWTKLTGFIGNNAGAKLKAASGWNSNGNGTNNYGFSALPGGWRNSDGSFFEVDSNSSWWSATEYNSSNASSRNVLYNGSIVGEYSSDKFNLCSVRCVQDKVKPVGNYKNGKKNGEWKFFYENGNLRYVFNYKDDEFHGECKWFYENGNLKEIGNYIDGKAQGEGKFFYESGNLQMIVNFKDDKTQGEGKLFYENGNLEKVINYKDDKFQGEVKEFHKNGKLKMVANFKDGKPHGEAKEFYENGNLKSVRNFKDGVEQH